VYIAECPESTFGLNCNLTCRCPPDDRCSKVNGLCSSGKCAYRWTGPGCQISTLTACVLERRGVARGAGGAGRTGRHLLGGGKPAKIVFKNSRENSDCRISYVFACNKNKALQRQRTSVSRAITLGLWLRPVRLCWYYANFVSGPVYTEY